VSFSGKSIVPAVNMIVGPKATRFYSCTFQRLQEKLPTDDFLFQIRVCTHKLCV